HHNGRGTCEAAIHIIFGGAQVGTIDLDVFFFEECDDFFGGTHPDLIGEHAAHAGSDDVWVVQVRFGVGNQDGIHGSSIGSAKECANVSWFFRGFGDQDQRLVVLEMDFLQTMVLCFHDSQNAFGGAPVCNFFINLFGNLDGLGTAVLRKSLNL